MTSRISLMKLRNQGAQIHKLFSGLALRAFHASHIFAVALLLFAMPESAYAQTWNFQFLCTIAQMIKYIGGGVALLAIAIWAIGFFFGESKFNDLALRIGIGAVVLIAANELVRLSGLQACQTW